MEFEVLMTGIGGQGIQLVAKTLALAAMREGRSPLLTSEVSGAMRGGHSLATVVVGDTALRGLPVVTSAAAALELHPMNWDEEVAPRLRPGALLVANSTLCPEDTTRDLRTYRIPATELCGELGSTQPMGFILLGAFNALTGLVDPESLTEAMRELLPAYRQQHVEVNRRAIALGAAQVPAAAEPVPLADTVAS